MSNNRKLGNLAQFLDSGSTKSVITASGGAFTTEPLLEADLTGTAPTGLSDSNLVKNLVDINHITETTGYASVSDAIPVILQNTNNIIPDSSGAYDLGDSAKPIAELILDSSANIFFGALSLTSILRSGTSAIAVAAAAAASPVSGSAETSFLLKTDSTQTDAQADASSNALTITEGGVSPTTFSTAFTPYHPKGYSAYFDGTGDYLVHGDGTSSAYITLSGDFTIEAFIFSNGDFVTQNNVFGSDLAYEQNYQVYLDASYNLAIYDNSTSYFSTGTVPQDEWAHIAITRSGSTVTYWINGQSAGTSTVSTTLKYRIIGGLIRSSNNSIYNSFNGYISNARIVNGTAIYTSSFTPPTEALTNVTNTELLACHLPYLKDGSSNDYDITVTGDVKLQQFGPFDHVAYSPSDHGGSVHFDGANEYLDIASSSQFGFGTNDLTIEAWVYWKTAPTSYEGIFNTLSTSTQKGVALCTDSTGRITFNMNNTSAANYTANNTGFTPKANQWYHIALTRSSNTVKIFVNGKQKGTDKTYNSDMGSSSAARVAEIYTNLTGYVPDAFIADLRVVNGSAVYTSDFTPPTSPLTDITNTALLTCANKNNVWNAGGAGNGLSNLLQGNATLSTSITKNESASVQLDGTGDYIKIDDTNPIFDVSTGDFTWEGWFRFNAFTDNPKIFVNLASATVYWQLYVYNNALRLLGNAGNTLSGTASGTLSTSTWYHIALVRDGNVFNVYLDGSLVITDSYSGSIGHNSDYGVGGTSTYPNNNINGNVEGVRLSKYARYTTTFTPPTAALEG